MEVALGPLAAGSTAGTNSTNGTVSVLGSLLSLTTNAWTLENTNGTGTYVVRLAVRSTSSIANLALLKIGVDNGTTTDQIVI